MANYIKWELKDYGYKKIPWLITYAIVFILFLVIPTDMDNFISTLINFSFCILIMVSLFGSFVFGTKKIIDTYRNKTFLLESMIPFPVKKIQIAKYIVGIIINLIFSIISIIGFSIVIIKAADISLLQDLLNKFLSDLTFTGVLRFSIMYILSTITFMSFIVLGYIISKVINPNGGKGNFFIACIISFFLMYLFGYITNSIDFGETNIELIYDIIYFVTSAILYFITTWLIENKLEIYN